MSEVKMLEDNLEAARKQAEFHKKLIRLTENPDFKELIIDGFIIAECARYTGLSVNLDVPADIRENSALFAKSTALLAQWIDRNLSLTQSAQEDIVMLEGELTLARQEEIQEEMNNA